MLSTIGAVFVVNFIAVIFVYAFAVTQAESPVPPKERLAQLNVFLAVVALFGMWIPMRMVSDWHQRFGRLQEESVVMGPAVIVFAGALFMTLALWAWTSITNKNFLVAALASMTALIGALAKFQPWILDFVGRYLAGAHLLELVAIYTTCAMVFALTARLAFSPQTSPAESD